MRLWKGGRGFWTFAVIGREEREKEGEEERERRGFFSGWEKRRGKKKVVIQVEG